MREPRTRRPRGSTAKPTGKGAPLLDVQHVQENLAAGLVPYVSATSEVTEVEVTPVRTGSIVLQFKNVEAGMGHFVTLSRSTSEALVKALERVLRGGDEVPERVYGELEYREIGADDNIEPGQKGETDRREAMLEVLERVRVLKAKLRQKYGEFDIDRDLEELREERLKRLG